MPPQTRSRSRRLSKADQREEDTSDEGDITEDDLASVRMLPEKRKKRFRKRDVSAGFAALVMLVAAAVSPMGHHWKDRHRQAFEDVVLTCRRLPSFGDVRTGFAPLFRTEVTLVFGVYIAIKLVIREATGGFKIDKRGWGRETYLAAFLHQIMTALVYIATMAVALREFGSIHAWFETTWGEVERRGMMLERVCVVMQLAEMFTDAIYYRTYPGFNAAYWAHHITTFMGSAGFYIVERVPVGLAFSFGCALEIGSIPLNYCNLFPSPRTYVWRAIGYIFSRALASVLFARLSWVAYYRPHLIAWPPLVPIWLLLAVNYRWAYAIAKATLSRNYVWST